MHFFISMEMHLFFNHRKKHKTKNTLKFCNGFTKTQTLTPVSYTHLDVYKRQIEACYKFKAFMTNLLKTI